VRKLALGLAGLTLLSLPGCASMERYLEEHRAERAESTFYYTQIGRVEFVGPFDIGLLQANRAWPASAQDAMEIQASFNIAVSQPVVVNGQLVYPSVQERRRSVRIMHKVKGWADRTPLPSWEGSVIHETTRVPWNGDGEEMGKYEGDWSYKKQYQKTHDDRPGNAAERSEERNRLENRP
jgi:hypothetical protein